MQSLLGDFPAKLIPSDDIHLTLFPPWDTNNVEYVGKLLKDSVKGLMSFELVLWRLTIGPDLRHPRYLWIECSPSPELLSLQNTISAYFSHHILPTHEVHNEISNGNESRRKFKPHITIARLKTQNHPPTIVKTIDVPLDIRMRVDSVQLFESRHQGGIGYVVLSNAVLNS